MELLEHNSLTPEAFRGFLEGVQNLKDYLRRNAGESLVNAERQLDKSLAADPNFTAARYYKAIVLTHARRPDDAISLLESLNQEDSPIKAEVLYNLAFAYARKYKYDFFKKSLEMLDEAEKSVPRHEFLGISFNTKRPDLVLLMQAMKAWVMAAFSGRAYGRDSEDFEQRRIEFLPKAEKLVKSVLGDQRLKKLAPDARTAVEVEANNAAGIAYMRMGQYSKQFEKTAKHYWQISESHYRAALKLHQRDVRVLDNLSTLNLIRACYAERHRQPDQVKAYASEARDAAERAISFNSFDRFRWLNLARAYALLRDWEKASEKADHILSEPGVATEKDVEKLKRAIDNRDVTPILESYPIEEKSSP